MRKIATALMIRKANDVWLDFLNNFTNYDTYVFVDDNGQDCTDYKKKYPNVNIIQIENEICQNNGYINATSFKKVSALDKCFYYFCKINTGYDYVWYFEDDVFFYDENTLINIDAQYIGYDFLTNKCLEKKTMPRWSHWRRININLQEPLWHCMHCASRIGNKMFKLVEEYVAINKSLVYHEVLPATIAKQNEVKYAQPLELSNIYYRYVWMKGLVKTTGLYHPVKKIDEHISFREYINSKNK